MINQFDWEGRSTERLRQEIREFLGCRKVTINDIHDFKAWFFINVFSNAIKRSQRIEHTYTYFRENKIEPFTSKKLEKHTGSAHREFEQQLFQSIYDKLDEKTKLLMDELLSDDAESDDDEINDDSEIKFKHIKIDIPGAKLKNVFRAIQKIDCLKQ